MARLTSEGVRWLALFSLCACSPGRVLESGSGSVSGWRHTAASKTAELPPMAADVLEREAVLDIQASATAGRAALQAPSAQPLAGGPSVSAMLPGRVFGVTITDVSPLEGIAEALSSLSRRATARVVFDVDRAAVTYAPALRELAGVSYIMGELVDSVAVANLSVDQYAARTSEYLDELGDVVDLWEIGNEVNGEWLGDPDRVAAKVAVAYDLVAAQHRPTALTLYYNEGCVQNPEHELFTWASRYVSPTLREGLDYVWVSYYEQRCHRPEPDWNSVFARLHELFPNAKLGFGGCGASDPERKRETLEHFYNLEVSEPRFVGGYFWWYFREDMLPPSTPLWGVLNSSWEASPQ